MGDHLDVEGEEAAAGEDEEAVLGALACHEDYTLNHNPSEEVLPLEEADHNSSNESVSAAGDGNDVDDVVEVVDDVLVYDMTVISTAQLCIIVIGLHPSITCTIGRSIALSIGCSV